VYEQVRQAVHTPTPPQPSAAGGSGADAGAAEKRGGKKEAVAAGVSGGGAEFAFALLARAVMANQQHHDAVPPRVRQTVHVSVDKRYNQHGGGNHCRSRRLGCRHTAPWGRSAHTGSPVAVGWCSAACPAALTGVIHPATDTPPAR